MRCGSDTEAAAKIGPIPPPALRYNRAMRPAFVAAAISFIALLSPVLAEACGPRVELEFFESDGGDVFRVHNKSQEPWSVASLVISLNGSRGRVVFDTADGGAGTSMHHPFNAISGDVGFVGASHIKDGDQVVTLAFSDFPPGKSFSFVIDTDAKTPEGYDKAMVSEYDIEGAGGEAEMVKGADKVRAKGVFGREGKAVIGEGGLCA